MKTSFNNVVKKKNLVLALALWCILFDVWSWSFFPVLYLHLFLQALVHMWRESWKIHFPSFSGTYLEIRQNCISVPLWEQGREAAMIQLSPPSLLHQQLGYFFQKLFLEDIATAFLAAHRERVLLCFSLRYAPWYRLCQNGSITLWLLFPWNPRESPLGKKVTCWHLKTLSSLHSTHWFTWL